MPAETLMPLVILARMLLLEVALGEVMIEEDEEGELSLEETRDAGGSGAEVIRVIEDGRFVTVKKLCACCEVEG